MFRTDLHILCCVSRSPDKPKKQKELCETISILGTYSHNEHKNKDGSVERGEEREGEERGKEEKREEARAKTLNISVHCTE